MNYYQAPDGWTPKESFVIDGVLYIHKPSGGVNGPRLLALKRGISCACGHTHTSAGVSYISNYDETTRFGLGVGCGIDKDSYAMQYAVDYGPPVLGCGIVIDGIEAHFVPWVR